MKHNAHVIQYRQMKWHGVNNNARLRRIQLSQEPEGPALEMARVCLTCGAKHYGLGEECLPCKVISYQI